jgi:hypothetical protein
MAAKRVAAEAMHLKILVWISLISLVFGVPYFRLPLG